MVTNVSIRSGHLVMILSLVLMAAGCAEPENEIDVEAIKQSQDEFRVKTQLVGTCSILPLKGEAWVDKKIPMLNGEDGAAEAAQEAYSEFIAELLANYTSLGEIGSVPLPGDDQRDTPLVDEIQSELFRLTVDLDGMANLNDSANFPVYLPPNNANFLNDLNSVCEEFRQLSDGE